jgi:hypothetical protein
MKLLQTKGTQIDVYHTLREQGCFSILSIDWDFSVWRSIVHLNQINIYFLCFLITINRAII